MCIRDSVKVLYDIRLAGVLAQCILTMSAETLRHQVVAIKLILVAVSYTHLDVYKRQEYNLFTLKKTNTY